MNGCNQRHRKVLSLLTVIAMVCCGFPSMQPLEASAGQYRNVALRRAAYHSSAANFNDTGHLVTDGIITSSTTSRIEVAAQYDDSPAGEEVDKAFDGDVGSKWLTFHNAAWIQVKVPADAPAVHRYTISSANDDPNRDPVDWVVEGSNDGINFTPLDTRTGQQFSGRFTTNTYTLSTPANYLYYRLRITKNKGDYRTQLSEWDLLSAEGKTILRQDNPAFYSVWTSGPATQQQYVYIDLGVPSTIDKVVLHWLDTNYAVQYDIQISDDAKNWTTIHRQNAGQGGVETISFTPKTAKYVRLLCRQSRGDCYMLSEMEVYGTNDLQYSVGEMPPPEADGTQYLTGGNWRVQRVSEVEATGAQLSSAGYNDQSWLPAVVPGTVLTSYLRAGAIPDPNVADQQLQISDSFFTADFWYRNSFVVPGSMQGKKVWLNFNSINWKADVYFNGAYLGKIEGAFIRGRFDITPLVKFDQDNYLAVYIHKNATPGQVSVQNKQSAGPNGGILGADNPTIHASIGWDWVPTIRGRNIGIYGDVYLECSGDVLLTDPHVIVDLDTENMDFSKADLTVKALVTNTTGQPLSKVSIQGSIADTDIAFESDQITLAAGETREITTRVTMHNPKLWWPNTYGEQHLYTMQLTAMIDKSTSQTRSFQFGVREFTYREQSPLTIYCNGIRITCVGGNWGMDDSNLAATPADYDVKIRLHAEANFTMIRNWVGMTNHKAFYDACDKYGILIWDDFWLANPSDGPNPKDEAMFIANARDKVLRNRYHASLVLYCGRNEGYPPDALNAAMQQLTRELDGTRVYIPHSAAGSVSGFGPYGVQESPKWYFQNTPQTLHSERGMPNIPAYESMLEMLTEEHAWPIDDVWGMHDFCASSAQNAASFEQRVQNYTSYDSLKSFVRGAQMVNYENHKAMFEAVYARRGNGMLMWMSQSAWPSMVWQTYDYYYDTNAGYFGLKKANQPIHAIWNPANNYLLLSNTTAQPLENATTLLRIYNFQGRKIFEQSFVTSQPADSLTLLTTLPNVMELEGATGMGFIVTQVFDHRGRLISDNFYWNNFKTYMANKSLDSLPTVTLKTAFKQLENAGDNSRYAVVLTNDSDTPALLARVKTLDKATGKRMLPVYYSDNYVSLMPGETRVITLEIDSRFSAGLPLFQVEGWNIAEADITDPIDQLPPEPSLEPPFTLGDVDGNGNINTTDARLTLQAAVGKIQLSNISDTAELAADVNRDGRVNTTDARLILQKAVNKIEDFPA